LLLWVFKAINVYHASEARAVDGTGHCHTGGATLASIRARVTVGAGNELQKMVSMIDIAATAAWHKA